MNTVLTLLLFGTPAGEKPAPPPEWWDCLPRRAKQAVIDEAARVNLYFPGREFADADSDFRGSVYFFRMRMNGTPLPRPLDPILGQADWGGPGPYLPPR